MLTCSIDETLVRLFGDDWIWQFPQVLLESGGNASCLKLLRFHFFYATCTANTQFHLKTDLK